MQPLLTPHQAAELLAISTRHLRDITSAGLVRYVDVGMRDRETRRYRMADLEAYVESNLRLGRYKAEAVPRLRSRRHKEAFPVVDFTEMLEAKQRQLAERREKRKAGRLPKGPRS